MPGLQHEFNMVTVQLAGRAGHLPALYSLTPSLTPSWAQLLGAQLGCRLHHPHVSGIAIIFSMLLVVICGQPAAGKSTLVAQLRDGFHARGVTLEVVDEPSLHLQRNESYQDAMREKNTRGSLRSAVDRALTGKTDVVILDTLNNIKGYRYELWCLARAAGARYCVVHVDSDEDLCRQHNKQRQEQDQYSDAILEDLLSRFERPDQRNRWDAPLFTIKPAGDADEASQAIQAIIASLCDEQVTPEGVAAVKDLKPTTATVKTTLAGTNTLHDMDQAVQEVIDCIVAAQADAAGGAAGLVRMQCQDNVSAASGTGQAAQGPGEPILQLEQVVSLAELRRHKRAFLKLATKLTFSRLSDAGAAQRMFVDYLIDNVTACSRPPKFATG